MKRAVQCPLLGLAPLAKYTKLLTGKYISNFSFVWMLSVCRFLIDESFKYLDYCKHNYCKYLNINLWSLMVLFPWVARRLNCVMDAVNLEAAAVPFSVLFRVLAAHLYIALDIAILSLCGPFQ